jgi:hypothetical protein
MSKAAIEASQGLGHFVDQNRHAIARGTVRAIEHARIDLEALGGLAGLILEYNFTPKNAVRLCLSMCYTAERIAARLKQVESDMG